MNTLDTLVVGGGLFGCVIARALRSAGQRVEILDREDPERGSAPAACLMKPSWIGTMSATDRNECLGLLGALYGQVHTLRFKVGPGWADVQWVPPRAILNEPKRLTAALDRLRRGPLGGWVADLGGESLHARKVVVAAGVWTPEVLGLVEGEVLSAPQVDAQAGLALLYPDCTLDEPFIRPWAPYKQLVAFNRGDGLWVGDGSAIKSSNWHAQRADAVAARCAEAVEARRAEDPAARFRRDRLFGLRPKVRDLGKAPAYLRRHARDLWVATGGAKNGTIGAAWCARELLREFA